MTTTKITIKKLLTLAALIASRNATVSLRAMDEQDAQALSAHQAQALDLAAQENTHTQTQEDQKELSAQEQAELDAALHKAAELGQLDEAKSLVAQRANVNTKNKNGTTPLLACISADKTSLNMAMYLLEQSADASIADKSGSTALGLMLDKTRPHPIDNPFLAKLLALLVKNKANINQPAFGLCIVHSDGLPLTPLEFFITKSNKEMTIFLLNELQATPTGHDLSKITSNFENIEDLRYPANKDVELREQPFTILNTYQQNCAVLDSLEKDESLLLLPPALIQIIAQYYCPSYTKKQCDALRMQEVTSNAAEAAKSSQNIKTQTCPWCVLL